MPFDLIFDSDPKLLAVELFLMGSIFIAKTPLTNVWHLLGILAPTLTAPLNNCGPHLKNLMAATMIGRTANPSTSYVLIYCRPGCLETLVLAGAGVVPREEEVTYGLPTKGGHG